MMTDSEIPIETGNAHAVGEYPDRMYGTDCDGVAILAPDPYLQSMFDDAGLVWLCSGVRAGRVAGV